MINTPVNNISIKQGNPYTISATANDSDGTINQVELFYNGNNLLSTIKTAPYTISGSTAQVPLGTYTITAKAYDDKGAVSTSSPIVITATP